MTRSRLNILTLLEPHIRNIPGRLGLGIVVSREEVDLSHQFLDVGELSVPVGLLDDQAVLVCHLVDAGDVGRRAVDVVSRLHLDDDEFRPNWLGLTQDGQMKTFIAKFIGTTGGIGMAIWLTM